MEKRKYTRRQILANIKLISKGREQDVNIPLRILKTAYPELYSKASLNFYKKIYFMRPENKEKNNKYFREYIQRPKVKEKRKLYTRTDKFKSYIKSYNQKPSVKKKVNAYRRKRRKTDPKFKISMDLRTGVYKALKHYSKTGKIWNAKKYGIDYEKIINHLKPFPKNIKNYHIDHIKPLSSFDLNKPEQIKKAFAPENHQWLTVEENLKKSNKII